MHGVLMLFARYLRLFASLVLNLCWGLSMACVLKVFIGLLVVERVGQAVVPVTLNGCGVCVIAVKRREEPFSISNGVVALRKLVDVYWMGKPGMNIRSVPFLSRTFIK